MRFTTFTMSRRSQPATFAAAAVTAACLLLSGCAFNAAPAVSTGPGTATSQIKVTGSVFGGQQPVIGAVIQLYAVGTNGVASQAIPLIATPPTSGAGGLFSITGMYSCTNATQVYITATGGNAGSGTNGAINLMVALGSCSTLLANAAVTNISINELSTVAAVYALAPFMTDYTHVGATGSNPSGLVNAFAMANALVNYSTGAIQLPPPGVSLPVNEINTLADILAACINSTSGFTSCGTLLSATGASETIGAGLAIAKNPGNPAITALWTLPSSAPPFVPTLTAQPNDFTIAYRYAGAELASPFGIALDANGNGWITNQAGRSVTRFPNPSAITLGTTSYTAGTALLAPRGISIDRAGNIWIANTGASNVVELNPAGLPAPGTPFTAGGLTAPVAIANDSAGNAWITNFNSSSLTALNSSGAAIDGSPITGGGTLNAPTGVAIDTAGRVNVANAGSGSLAVFSNAGTLLSTVSDGTLLGATAVATSGTGFAMAGSTTGAAVTGAFAYGSTAGTSGPASPIVGGGLTLPVAVAYDGAGTAWFANTASISAFNGTSPLAPATGFGSLSAPQGIAIDASGNVWTTNSGDNSVSIFVGLATPVGTPLAVNVGP